MVVRFHGKRLETPLVKVSAADPVPGPLPTLSRGVGEPLQEGGKVAIVLRPEDRMPVSVWKIIPPGEKRRVRGMNAFYPDSLLFPIHAPDPFILYLPHG